MVLGLCFVQIAVWTLAPALVARAPPYDVIEGYVWGREWVIGTYKHPALPSWVLEASRIATGCIGWPAYFISQAFVAATYLCVFGLGRDLIGSHRAAAAPLLLALTHYFSWRSPEFNHSIAQAPFWVATVWALWRAVEKRTNGCWLLVGMLAATGMYAKLSTVVVICVGALWLLCDRDARASLRTTGPWVGLCVFLLFTGPLLYWLWNTSLLPLHYIHERSHHHAVAAPVFLGIQIAHHAGVLAALAWSIHHKGSRSGPFDAAPKVLVASPAMRFLAVMAVGPLIAVTAMSAIFGIRLRPDWGSSFPPLLALLAAAIAWPSSSNAALRRLITVVTIVLVAVPAAYVGDALYGVGKSYKNRTPFRMQQINYPQREITERVVKIWQEATDQPLKIVVGNMQIAGLIALGAPGSPTFVDVSYPKSHRVTSEHLRSDGALFVWAEARDPIDLDQLLGGHRSDRQGKITVAWPRGRNNESITIGYAIILPDAENNGTHSRSR